ncbi:MAG: PD-(D/E)XK nuclease family protein [Nitriliruptor sp.]|nr:MAG: PD-(D/E)XK nuclease family protein [Nitriliruptor sp.]
MSSPNAGSQGPSRLPSASEDGAPPRLLEVEDAPPGTFGEFEPTAPPLTDAQGRIRLSFSRIDTYRTCPRKFRFRYVDRLPTQPSPHLSFGTSIHGALEAFHDRKLPDPPSEDELLGFLYDAWDTRGFADLPREEQVAHYRHAQQVLRRYHARQRPPGRTTAATEAWFEVPFAYEAVVVGSIDRVDVDADGDLHVIDYKTNRRARPRSEVAASLQLALYALACRHLYGALPRTVALDFVVPGLEVIVGLEELDLEAARATVLETAAAIRAERFETVPNRLCGWCDHRAVCPAWEGEADDTFGAAVTTAEQLRRRLRREVRELRELEAGIARLATERGLDT